MNKSSFIFFLFAVGLHAAGIAQAADQTSLAAAKGCMACHDVKAKSLGPAFNQVAMRYSTKDTEMLAKRVLEGGSGSWGNVPMPSNATTGVTEADARKLVGWILTLK